LCENWRQVSGLSNKLYLNQPFKLRLPGIDCLVEFVNAKGPGCLVFKKDLKRAFRQILIDPADCPLLGTCIDDGLYFHTSLPFSLLSATLICQHTTKSITYILNKEAILVDVYIDDFYGVDIPSSAESSFLQMNTLFDELGVLAFPEKDAPPCTQMLCLGAKHKSGQAYFLTCNDVSFASTGAVFQIYRTKTIQFHQRLHVLEILLPFLPNSILCPVSALLIYFKQTVSELE